MRKRMIVMLAVVVAFVAALGLVKYLQIRAAIAQGASWAPPPEAVTTAIARDVDWPASYKAIGSVAAVRGVTVSADLPGVVRSIGFESGHRVDAGQVLVRLDAGQEQAQLAAAEAQSELARLNLERSKKLLVQEVVSQAEYDQTAATAKQADANVGALRATVSRKVIRAPFAGTLGIRQVNLGQYLQAGDPVVPLQSMDPVYVNFSLPQQDVVTLKVGDEVRVSSDSAATQRSGRITAINSVIDEATRNVQVQATFANPTGALRPGMFVNVEVVLNGSQHAIALPASAISYAPYGNSVFVVADMKDPKGKTYRGVRQQFVKTGGSRGDQVAVTEGVQPGDEVVTSGVFKLRNGAAVLVNNAKRPSDSAAPKPEDS